MHEQAIVKFNTPEKNLFIEINDFQWALLEWLENNELLRENVSFGEIDLDSLC